MTGTGAWRLALCGGLLLGWAGVAAGYDVVPVADGGTIEGTVMLTGPAPDAKVFELRRTPDRAYCGALSDGSGYRLLREVTADAGGRLQNVVVTVEHVRAGKAFGWEEARLEANVCQFLPFVTVLRDRHPLTVINLDPVSHDLQVYERDEEHVFIMFHRPSLTKTGTTDLIKLTGARKEMTMQCGFHPYMQAHGLIVDNPYYAVTGRDGAFKIADLPAGTYRVKAWHPLLGTQVQQVTVTANGKSALDFHLAAR